MRVIRIHELLLYIVGAAFLLAGAGAILLAFYSLPYLVWGASYDVPELLIQFGSWFQQSQQAGKPLQLFAILFPTFLISSILILLGYLIVSWVDHRTRPYVYERPPHSGAGNNKVMKMLMLILLVIVLVIAFWLGDYYLLNNKL